MVSNGTNGSTLPEIGVVRKWFNELGYPDDLMRADWRMHTSIMQSNKPTTIHAMAFWARPFDQFRSAIAVDRPNGLPPTDQAKKLSDLTNSHVLLCGNGQATLWLREWPGSVKSVGTASMTGVPNLLNEQRGNLELTKIATTKIRVRQYALYETDPQGQRDESWFIKPDLEKTRSVFTRIGTEVETICQDYNIDHASWLYRILALRVGADRDWKIAQGLNQSTVSDYVKIGKQYPTFWSAPISDEETERITEIVLASLQFFTFSYIDPLLLLQVLRLPSAKKVESRINLFPTPRSAAWDMIASIPIHDEMIIFDPTVGTGTFLIAAAQSLWNTYGNRSDMMAVLRELVRGSDTSAFAVDLAHILLDFAFGWEDSGWKLSRRPAEKIAEIISPKNEWLVVGNPPWDAVGRSNNKASIILSAYIDALRHVPKCWLGTIVPRSVWTKRDGSGVSIRNRVASSFQVETICEMPWGAIEGGRSQSLAVLLSRGYPQSTTVWKRNDKQDVIHTIGYNLGSRKSSFTTSPDGRFLAQCMSGTKTISDFFNVRIGLQPVSVKQLHSKSEKRGDIPFVLDVGSGPAVLIRKESIEDDTWVAAHFIRSAKAYRQEITRLPQVAISGSIYEGTQRLRAFVVDEPCVFSNRFVVCTPRGDVSSELAHGLKTILTSVLGKLWIHIFASAGRHIAKTDLEKLPLPPYQKVVSIATKCATNSEWIQHLTICDAYGLTIEESAAIMALGSMLEIGSEIPRSVVNRLKPDERIIEDILRQIQEIDSHDDDDVLRLELKMIDEMDKETYLLLSGDDYQIAIDKGTL